MTTAGSASASRRWPFSLASPAFTWGSSCRAAFRRSLARHDRSDRRARFAAARSLLGTLIGSAYSFYATQKSELETLAAREVQLDLALAEFGPETKEVRVGMKRMLEGVRAMLWGDGGADSASELSTAAPIEHLRILDLYIASLDPKTPAQRQFAAAAAADAGVIEQTACSYRCNWRARSPGLWSSLSSRGR